MLSDIIFKEMSYYAIEMMLFFDANGRVIYANKVAEELLSYEGGVVDKNITDIFPQVISFDDRLSFNISIANELKPMMAYRGNRTCFAVEGKINKVKDEPEEYVCMAMDTTKQDYYEKRANQADIQADSANQVKTQFVANVTHELRTPVNGILGNAQELMGLERDPDKQKLLKLIERGCRDMHSIINNILDFSKLEAGKFSLEKREFDFRSMMEYVKANHMKKITEKGLQFVVNISSNIPDILIGDELRIVQVLNNLLSNAEKFTSAGKITLEAVKTAQLKNRIELFFMVIDTGIGISRENQDKLFKSFSQAEASTTRKYGGTGLGLYISKQLIEMMDGSIHLESELNHGTMFAFHIWIEVKDEDGINMSDDKQVYDVKIPTLADFGQNDRMFEFGSPANTDEIKKKMTKLILSVEMKNWEKAEMFMESIKQLTAGAQGDVKSATLRLKMAVQKNDYDKTIQAYEVFKNTLNV